MKSDTTAESAAADGTSAARKVFVKTYGCQMNVYDSQRMTDALAADGYAETDRVEAAHVGGPFVTEAYYRPALEGA